MRRLLALALFACLNLPGARADQRPDWARLFDETGHAGPASGAW